MEYQPLTDIDAKRIDDSIHLAYWPTFNQAIAAAHLKRLITSGLPDMIVVKRNPGEYEIKRREFLKVNDNAVALIDEVPQSKPAPERSRIEQELAELRSDLTDLAKRVNDAISTYAIKPEQQPQ